MNQLIQQRPAAKKQSGGSGWLNLTGINDGEVLVYFLAFIVLCGVLFGLFCLVRWAWRKWHAADADARTVPATASTRSPSVVRTH